MTDRDRLYADRSLQTLGRNLSRQSVMEFQREREIKVDGIIGPQTRGALRQAMSERDRSTFDPFRVEGAPTAPSERQLRDQPRGTVRAGELARQDEQRRRTTVPTADGPAPGANQRERWQHYANIVEANDGEMNPGGRPTVLGIRERNGVTRRFEDKIVVLGADGRVSEFAASTRPSNTTRKNGGVAQLATGNYEVSPNGAHYGRPSWHVKTLDGSGHVPVHRDLNGDGQYSAAERAQRRTGTEILFHVPNPTYRDAVPTSIGCINIPNRDWDRFTAALGGTRARFNFTLVDGG